LNVMPGGRPEIEVGLPCSVMLAGISTTAQPPTTNWRMVSVTVRLPLPEFEIVRLRAAVAPTGTSPKARVPLTLMTRVGAGAHWPASA
jgi:hypothetical protein